MRLVRERHERRAGIGCRVHRDGFDPHLAAGTNDPHGNLAAVGDQQATDTHPPPFSHAASPRIQRSLSRTIHVSQPERFPQMQHGVGAPGPPAFRRGDLIRPRNAERFERLDDAEVGGGEGVAIAEDAHPHIRRGPRADAGQRDERRLRVIGRQLRQPRAIQPPARKRLGQPRDRGRLRTRQPDRAQRIGARGGNRLGPGKRVERAGPRRVRRGSKLDRRPELPGETVGHRAGRAHRDLLSQHRADQALERIDQARQPDVRPPLHERPQQRVAPDVRDERLQVAVQVEHAADGAPNASRVSVGAAAGLNDTSEPASPDCLWLTYRMVSKADAPSMQTLRM